MMPPGYGLVDARHGNSKIRILTVRNECKVGLREGQAHISLVMATLPNLVVTLVLCCSSHSRYLWMSEQEMSCSQIAVRGRLCLPIQLMMAVQASMAMALVEEAPVHELMPVQEMPQELLPVQGADHEPVPVQRVVQNQVQVLVQAVAHEPVPVQRTIHEQVMVKVTGKMECIVASLGLCLDRSL